MAGLLLFCMSLFYLAKLTSSWPPLTAWHSWKSKPRGIISIQLKIFQVSVFQQQLNRTLSKLSQSLYTAETKPMHGPDNWIFYYYVQPCQANLWLSYRIFCTMFLDSSPVCPIHVTAISQVHLGGNYFEFTSNIHLDSRMNWLDFGGQRSLWSYISHEHREFCPGWPD